MTITLQWVQVRTGSQDRDGRLVYFGGELAAVLVQLEDEIHGPDRGKWFLETGFGSLALHPAPLFASLGDAEAWLAVNSTST